MFFPRNLKAFFYCPLGRFSSYGIQALQIFLYEVIFVVVVEAFKIISSSPLLIFQMIYLGVSLFLFILSSMHVLYFGETNVSLFFNFWYSFLSDVGPPELIIWLLLFWS